MNVREALLLESAQDELILRRVALSLLKEVEKTAKATKQDQFSRMVKGKNLPELVRLHPALEALSIVVRFIKTDRPMRLDITGSFASDSNSSQVNLLAVINDQDQINDRNDFVLSVVHELRHALDNAKSKGAAFTRKNHNQSYLRQPVEINARFSEVTTQIDKNLIMNLQRGRIIPFSDYFDHFVVVAKRNELIDIFLDALPKSPSKEGAKVRGNFNNPKYRRLVSRLYAHYDYIVSAYGQNQ